MMNAFEHFLRNSQRDVPPLVAWTPVADHKHTRLILEKFTNLINTQIPQLSDFRNGIVPLDVHRGLDLGWYGHCVAATPQRLAKIDEYLVEETLRLPCSPKKDSSCILASEELR
jgi:hypothetical protein